VLPVGKDFDARSRRGGQLADHPDTLPMINQCMIMTDFVSVYRSIMARPISRPTPDCL
jgi:hypothetical protein